MRESASLQGEETLPDSCTLGVTSVPKQTTYGRQVTYSSTGSGTETSFRAEAFRNERPTLLATVGAAEHAQRSLTLRATCRRPAHWKRLSYPGSVANPRHSSEPPRVSTQIIHSLKKVDRDAIEGKAGEESRQTSLPWETEISAEDLDLSRAQLFACPRCTAKAIAQVSGLAVVLDRATNTRAPTHFQSSDDALGSYPAGRGVRRRLDDPEIGRWSDTLVVLVGSIRLASSTRELRRIL